MVTPEPQVNGAVGPIEVAGCPASVPKRVAVADIDRIEAATRDFRIAQATSHLLQDDIDPAATVGAEAIELATAVRSTRVHDRLLPLKREADRRRDNTNARALSEHIGTVTTTRAHCH